jgi:hypothetical protein
MDLSPLLGRCVSGSGGIYQIIKVDNKNNKVLIEWLNGGPSAYYIDYQQLKNDILKYGYEWIHTDSYKQNGQIVTYDDKIFDKIELNKNSIFEKEISDIYPKCDCGGSSIGLKDYQVGHATYCSVYHGKKYER